MTKIRNQDQLLDAAAKVFAEKGYGAARLEDIAAEVGVLQGSLYYHIGSKAGLLRMLRVRRFRIIADRIAAIADGPGTAHDKLQRAMRAHLRYIEEYLGEAPQWFTRPADPRRTPAEKEEDRQLTAGYRARWTAMLREGIDSGEIRADIDVALAALSILGMLNWATQWFEPDGRCTIDDVAVAQFDLAWRGLARDVPSK